MVQHPCTEAKRQQQRGAGVEGQLEAEHVHNLWGRKAGRQKAWACLHEERRGEERGGGAPLTLAPQNSAGGCGSGVTIVTVSPASLSPLIKHSKRFFIPDMCENGLGSTNSVTLFPSLMVGKAGTGTGSNNAPPAYNLLRRGPCHAAADSGGCFVHEVVLGLPAAYRVSEMVNLLP